MSFNLAIGMSGPWLFINTRISLLLEATIPWSFFNRTADTILHDDPGE